MNLQTIESVLESSDKEIFHQIDKASAVIYNRTLSDELEQEVNDFLKIPDFSEISKTGTVKSIAKFLKKYLENYPLLYQDMSQYVEAFSEATGSKKVKFLLFVVASDMCRKFHTDVNDYRLLCTYQGVGTYYVLPEHTDFQTETPPEEHIKVLPIGSVILFRGALSATEEYPALLHKSPPAKTLGTERLLLRLDTNASLW